MQCSQEKHLLVKIYIFLNNSERLYHLVVIIISLSVIWYSSHKTRKIFFNQQLFFLNLFV